MAKYSDQQMHWHINLVKEMEIKSGHTKTQTYYKLFTNPNHCITLIFAYNKRKNGLSEHRKWGSDKTEHLFVFSLAWKSWPMQCTAVLRITVNQNWENPFGDWVIFMWYFECMPVSRLFSTLRLYVKKQTKQGRKRAHRLIF